jgi:enamine deaminase RidA (YjgF/YER057c/UK114 family)
MREAIQTHLPKPNQPFSWAVRAGGLIFTVHAAVDANGAIAGKNIAEQAELTFSNLAATVKAGGAGLDDVAQIVIYMREAAHMATIDDIYRRYFREPYPSRASLVVKDFVHPDMLIEVIATVSPQVA